MGKMNVAQNIHIVPLRAVTQDTASFVVPHINMKLYDKVEFLVLLGAIATDGFTMTVTQSAVTAGTTSTAIAARYRLTATYGTDTMGAVTALASTGLDVVETGAYDTMTLIVDVDSSDLTTADKPYVGLTFTDPANADQISTIIALCWPKYPKETNASALT